jgi:hypothetical protein
MATTIRMPRYDVRNDGAGPYAVFYCDRCNREFRSQPDITSTIANDIGRQAMGGVLRGVPLFGRAIADQVTGPDPRYSSHLSPAQLQAAWNQVSDRFHECATCGQIVCPSDWDPQANTCKDDSPRRGEIAEAEAEQAAGMVKGLASAFGLGAAIKGAADAAKMAASNAARCPKDGTMAAPGTKFCPQCGGPMVQPTPPAAAAATGSCPSCGAATGGAKFCPQCGQKLAVATNCPNCGAETKGAKFCPECGTKLG